MQICSSERKKVILMKYFVLILSLVFFGFLTVNGQSMPQETNTEKTEANQEIKSEKEETPQLKTIKFSFEYELINENDIRLEVIEEELEVLA